MGQREEVSPILGKTLQILLYVQQINVDFD